MAELRPGVEPVDLDTWFVKNCEPGIMRYLVDELGFSPAEMEVEHRIWREFTSRETPHFYPGFLDVLADYQARGGLVVVVSHSEERVIRSHYAAADGHRVAPDLVFGWDLGPDRRKPNPYPVHETIRRFDLAPRDVLVVDDLRPGVDMALAAGVDVAAAGWSHSIPSIRAFMQRYCVAYLETIEDLAEVVLR